LDTGASGQSKGREYVLKGQHPELEITPTNMSVAIISPVTDQAFPKAQTIQEII